MFITLPKKIIRIMLIIILLPCIVMYTYNKNAKLVQPTNTRVANGIIPIHFWKTKQGASVYFVPTENKPVIDLQITFNAGSIRDNGKLGLSYLVSQGLVAGTNASSMDSILESFDKLGVLYSANIDPDRANFKLRTVNNLKQLRRAVDLLAEVISTPTFPQLNINLIKDKLLIELNLDREINNKDYLLNSEFYKLLYNQHPYAYQGLDNGYLDQITREDLADFHSRYYVANNCVITIVGSIHRDVARDLSNLITATLNTGSEAEILPNPILSSEDFIKKVPTNVTGASEVIMGQLVPSLYDKDHINLIVGNAILGNNQYARLIQLTKNISAEGPLIYDVSGNLKFLRNSSPFFVKFYTKKELEREAIANVKQVLTDFVDNGPTDRELTLIKQHLINAWVMQFTTNENILAWVSRVGFYHLPFDFFDSYIENLSSVTKESIQQTWKKLINPNLMVMVILG